MMAVDLVCMIGSADVSVNQLASTLTIMEIFDGYSMMFGEITPNGQAYRTIGVASCETVLEFDTIILPFVHM